MQPQKAAIHSGRFSPQNRTASPFSNARGMQAVGKASGGARCFAVGVRVGAITVVIDEKRLVDICKAGEEICEGLAGHRIHYGRSCSRINFVL